MAASKFTEDNREAIVASVRAGASLPDAAREQEIRPSTVKGWITRGHSEEAGPYFEFADMVAAARLEREGDAPPMTREEFQRRLDTAVRAGSVTAMKLWHERDTRKAGEEPVGRGSKIASLADRRRAKEAAR